MAHFLALGLSNAVAAGALAIVALLACGLSWIRLTRVMPAATPRQMSWAGWLTVAALGLLLPFGPTLAQVAPKPAEPRADVKPEDRPPTDPRSVPAEAMQDPVAFDPRGVKLGGG